MNDGDLLRILLGVRVEGGGDSATNCSNFVETIDASNIVSKCRSLIGDLTMRPVLLSRMVENHTYVIWGTRRRV